MAFTPGPALYELTTFWIMIELGLDTTYGNKNITSTGVYYSETPPSIPVVLTTLIDTSSWCYEK